MTGYSLYQAATGEGDLPVPAFLWGPVFVMEAAGAASGVLSLAIGPSGGGPRGLPPSTHGHHTIPVYLCGAVAQPKYANIAASQHAMIHAQIAGIALTIKAAEEYAYKTLGRIRRGEVLIIAQTDQGRAAIARALEALYQTCWWATGRAPNTIGKAFTASKPGYLSGVETSLPWCSRKGP